MNKPIDLVLDRLDVRHRNGSTATARCPAHDDSSPSLSVSEGDDGQVVLHCLPGIGNDTLDHLAALCVALRAPCGDIRVPLRPPFPPDSVPCPICFAIRDGELGVTG